MTVTRLNMRIDDDLKQQAKEVYNDMGMDLTTAITIFLKQSVREQRLPFQPSREPIENVIARYEVDNNLTTKVNSIDEPIENVIARYEVDNNLTTKVNSIDELMESLNADD